MGDIIDYLNLYCDECDEEYYGIPVLDEEQPTTCPICGHDCEVI